MRRITLLAFIFGAAATSIAQNPSPKPSYDFSWPREKRVKLAESAAPVEISSKATIYLLEPHGYVRISNGTNGFSCLVDRQTPWNSEPTCFDAEGTATTLLTRLFVEDERGKGKSEEQIDAEVAARYKDGTFKAPSKPGIVYMLSDSTYLLSPATDTIIHAPPHLMFYAPYASEKDIGAPSPAPNLPYVIRPGEPDAYIIVMPTSGKNASSTKRSPKSSRGSQVTKPVRSRD